MNFNESTTRALKPEHPRGLVWRPSSDNSCWWPAIGGIDNDRYLQIGTLSLSTNAEEDAVKIWFIGLNSRQNQAEIQHGLKKEELWWLSDYRGLLGSFPSNSTNSPWSQSDNASSVSLWDYKLPGETRFSPSGGRGRFSGPFRLAAPPGWRGCAVSGWRPWFCRRPHRGQIHTPAGASSLHLCLTASHGLATWTLRSSCICRRDKMQQEGFFQCVGKHASLWFDVWFQG